MWTKLQAHFHYTTATILAIIGAAITLATTLGLHVSPSVRDGILQLAGLVLGGIVVGGGVKSAGMLQAGIHPLQKAELKADLAQTHAILAAAPLEHEHEPGKLHISLIADHGPETIRPIRVSHTRHYDHHGDGDHPILQAHGSFKGLALGKHKPVVDARTPMLGEFMDAKLGVKLPKQTNWLPPLEQALGDFGMMGNDTYGDCTCAALGHAIQLWTGEDGQPPVTLTTAQILDLYWATGTQDDGRDMFQVLKYVHANGLAGHTFGAYVGVGLRRYSHRDVKAAIDLFGGCYLGVALPETAQSQSLWDVVGDPTKPGPAQAGSWGGHAIWLADYDHVGPTCITWGHPLKMTWKFLDAYADEGFALIGNDWLKGGKTVEGLDLAALTSYLNIIKSGYQG